MNEYYIKSVSYSQVEARSEAEAIQKYKENVLEYICDNWEVEVIDDKVNHEYTKWSLDDVKNIFAKNNIMYRVEDKYTWKEDGLTQYEVTIFVNEENLINEEQTRISEGIDLKDDTDDEYYKCSKCGVINDDVASCMNCDIELCCDCDENDMPFGADDHVYCTPCVEKLFKDSDYIDLPLSDEEIKS